MKRRNKCLYLCVARTLAEYRQFRVSGVLNTFPMLGPYLTRFVAKIALPAPKSKMKTIKIVRSFAGLTFSALLAAVSLISDAKAQAISLNFGDFTINAQGYSSSNLSTNSSAGTLGARPTSAGPLEDTWGIFQVTSVVSGGSPRFTDNLGTEYWGVFYNSFDTSATQSGPVIVFNSEGLKLDIYRVNISDVGDAAFANVFNQGTAGRGAVGPIEGFDGITRADATINGGTFGSKVLSSTLTGPMISTFNTNVLTTSASGQLTVLPGQTMFDTGSGIISPMTFSFSGNTDSPTVVVPSDWTVQFGGPVSGVVSGVPDSGVTALMLGLLLPVFAFLRRKL